MTDPSDPSPHDPLDELASAHLDGETTAAEDDQVAADPALAARIAALAALRDAVRAAGPPVDEARRDATIAAALAAFDDDGAGAVAGDRPPEVTPITVAAARRRVSRRGVQVIGAVAVAVLLAVAVPLLGALDSDSDPDSDDVATSALEESAADDDDGVAAERDGGDAAAGAADALAPSAGTLALPTGPPVDFGTYDDLDAVVDAVEAYVGPLPATGGDTATASTTARTVEQADACPDAPDAGTRVLTGTATVDGRPVLVRVHQRPDGERAVVVLDAADCTVLTD